MANQVISSDSNHDELTGRLAGEDIAIQGGAVLTIDSMPHRTAMGILGDITITAGTLYIDGTRTFEVAYSGGSGTLPTVGTQISWNGGADTGKIVALNSGNNVSGILTLTKDVNTTTPDSDDSITDGSWLANLDSVKVGFLIVYGEDQDWGSVDAQSVFRITGDWYEVGVGDGTNNQSFTLPHNGHQHAVWVETGAGTNVFEIWHRVASDGVSTVYYNSLTQWGGSWESGFVFNQSFGSSTLSFGTSTAGGAPPNGARIRIPNVHLGTTTTANPTTEINSVTLASHASIIAPNTNLNIQIDHLNCSSMRIEFIGTNAVNVSDSCWSLSNVASLINKVNSNVVLDNCAIINPGNTTGGIAHGALQNYVILDNIGGITINDCVFMGALNGNNAGVLNLTTMANIAFTGKCKLVSNQQDENTCATLRGSIAVNVSAETLVLLGGSLYALAGCNNWEIDELIFGLPPGRGTTEQNINCINIAGTQNFKINSGKKASGAKVGTIGAFILTDSFDTWISNFGTVDNKIDGENRLTYVISCNGITSGVTLKRVYFDNLNSASDFLLLNSCANVLIENCSGDYNSEIEPDCNRTLFKGVHGGSGGPGSATGIEDDLVNVIGTCFYDVFTSDTAGLVGLVFNDKGNFHAGDVTITAGTPFFNGLGDLVMNTVGDQIVYEFPYWIRGHTALSNITPSKIGINPNNISAEYSLDTGSGYGAWNDATDVNLSSETIDPSGFKIRFRFTTTTGTSQNLRGFAIYTDTTINAQLNNLYPLNVVTVKVTVLDIDTELPIEGARVYLKKVSDNTVIFNDLTDSNGVVQDTGFEFESSIAVSGRVRKASSAPLYKNSVISATVTSSGLDLTIFMIKDE